MLRWIVKQALAFAFGWILGIIAIGIVFVLVMKFLYSHGTDYSAY